VYCTFLQIIVHGNIGAVRRTHVTGGDILAALCFFQNIGMDLQAVRRTHVGGDIFLAALYFPPKHWHGIAAVMNSYLS
jgi:hypothetical protein